jgi:CubicO group peptidase (beta-lactamase class C family)
MSSICDQVCAWVRDEGVAPLAAAGFARRRAGRWHEATGGARDAIFDLASVTKPIVAVAFARSGLDRGASVAALVEEAAGTHAGPLPLELLFAHRAGLEAHGKLWTPLLEDGPFDRRAALRVAASSARAPLGPAPWDALYSDLGYVLAGEALGRGVGAATDEAVHELVVGPLGVAGGLGSARTFARAGIDLRAVAAPTELVPWRDDGGLLRGRVHDENAWALSPEGVQGHAGLFGNVEAVLRFGEAVLDALDGHASPLGARGGLDWLVAPRPGGSLRAGFDGKSDAGSSAGSVLGPRTFGHLGFTGTSVWIDPEHEVVVTLLTNRVSPTRDNVKIRAARPRAHDELARAALGA